MIPSTAIEVIIPARGEAVISSNNVVLEYPKARGTLVITTWRVSVAGEPVAEIYRGGSLESVRKALLNIGYESLVSVSARRERKLFLKEVGKIELVYETLEGIVKKAMLEVSSKVVDEVVREVKALSSRFKSQKIEKAPLKPFLSFIEFLAIDKGIKPLYYDTVTRCIAVGSSYFCIKGVEWELEGSQDIIPRAEAWIKEFKRRS